MLPKLSASLTILCAPFSFTFYALQVANIMDDVMPISNLNGHQLDLAMLVAPLPDMTSATM